MRYIYFLVCYIISVFSKNDTKYKKTRNINNIKKNKTSVQKRVHFTANQSKSQQKPVLFRFSESSTFSK